MSFAIILGHISICSADSTFIAGYAGSGWGSIADLSSAVVTSHRKDHPQYDEVVTIKVCVTEVSHASLRPGYREDKGVWAFTGFLRNGKLERMWLQDNEGNFRDDYYPTKFAPDNRLHVEFFYKLWNAAKRNVKG